MFFFILLSFFLFLGYLLFEPFLKIIFLAVFFSIIFYPAYLKVKKFVKSPSLSSLIVTILILLFILIPGTFITVFLSEQMIALYPKIIKAISQAGNIEAYLKNFPLINTISEKLKMNLEFFNIDMSETLKGMFNYIANFIISQGKNIIINFTLFIVGIIVMLITIFFLFKDGEVLYRRLYELVPLTQKEKNFLINRTYNAIQGIVLGLILTAIAQGILAAIGYAVVGVEFAIFWGFMTFLASFLPVGGASLVWVPIAIYVFFTKGIIDGIIITLWGTFLVSTIDNIIKPIIIGDKTNIHPMVLAFGLLGGLNLFGFIGIFVAPLILVLIDNLLDIYKERYID